MGLIEAVRTGWGWCGIDPVEVVGENDFGNLMVKDVLGQYWRLCPEELYCRVVARDRPEIDRLSKDQDFLHDRYVRRLVDRAFQKLGVLPEGRKYCLKIPAVLGGSYDANNLATISLEELVLASGDIAHQLKDLPDGAQVRIRVTE